MLGIDQGGIQAEPAQHGQPGEDRDAVGLEIVEQRQQGRPLTGELPLVDPTVRGREFDLHHGVGPRRQLPGHELFATTQQERPQPAAQPLQRIGVPVLLDGGAVQRPEVLDAGQHSPAGQGGHRPQFGEIVLHRCAGDRQQEIRPQAGERREELGAGVLGLLGLVQDHTRPVDARVGLGVQAQDGRAGHHDVVPSRVLGDRRGGLGLGGRAPRHPQRRHEPAGLRLPVGHHRRGRHHQERARIRLRGRAHAVGVRVGLVGVGDERECLDGLAQPHVVGQDSADLVTPQHGQPVQPLLLIGPELGVQRRGGGHRVGLVRGQLEQCPGPPRGRVEIVGQFRQVRQQSGLPQPDPDLAALRRATRAVRGRRERLLQQHLELAEPLQVHGDQDPVGGDELVLPGDDGLEDHGERHRLALDGHRHRQSQPVDPGPVLLCRQRDPQVLGGPADPRDLLGHGHTDAVQRVQLGDALGQERRGVRPGDPELAHVDQPFPSGLRDRAHELDRPAVGLVRPGQAQVRLGQLAHPPRLGPVPHAQDHDVMPLQDE